MDLGSVLVGLGILFVVMAPIFWLQWSGKSNKERRNKQFKDHALALGMRVEYQSMWSNNYCLGLGNNGRALLYLNERQVGDPFVSIDLTAVKGCKLVVDSRKLVRDNESIVVVDRISFAFTFHNTSEAGRSILIFDTDADPSISDQLIFAKEWDQRISDILKSFPSVQKKKVAA